ncbi:MAG: carbon storage regulator [Pirellulales bacterium]
MLVLTRKYQEKIRIGEHITITVLKMKGKTVRLGIEAPVEVPVIRGELTFEGQAVEWQPESSDGEPGPPRPMSVDSSHTGRALAHWPTKPQSNGVSSRASESALPRVSLQRVSREQVSQVLPKMVAGSSPLREMLNRRSVTA